MEHVASSANLHLCCTCPQTILVVSSPLQGVMFSLLIMAVHRDTTLNLVGQRSDLVWQSLFSSDTMRMVNFLIL